MSSWVMAVEVTPSELVAVEVDRADGAADGTTPRTAALAPDGDAVDVLADALTALVPGGDRPARLVVATPADTERRRFEEIAEATALVGLPAPTWLPGPVAAVGDRLATEVAVGDRSIVLDTRDGALTAWPVVRTADGAEVGARGPVATGTRLDQLLLGVVRAQLRSLDPAAGDVGGPRPAVRGSGDSRGEAARLRREVRRARTRLADTDAAVARVTAGEHTVTVDRGVFDQLVEHALQETVGEIDRSAAGSGGDRSGVVLVLTERATPLARRLGGLVGGADEALVLPGAATDGVLGLAALLRPARPRPTRAASGAQAIRSRRPVGSPSAPVGVGATIAAGAGSAPTLDEPPGPREPVTPPRGLPGLDPSGDPPADSPADPASEPAVVEPAGAGTPEETTAADGTPVGADGPEIPAARLPSTPVQAQRGSEAWPQAFGTGATSRGGGVAAPPALVADADRDRGGPGVAGHAALAAARPHDARPTSDAPPGNSGPLRRPETGADPTSSGGPGTGPVVRRRGPDTAPQPVAEEAGTRRPPRGAVPALVVLLLVAVLAAAGVLVLGPDQISAAFVGLGAGVVQLVTPGW